MPSFVPARQSRLYEEVATQLRDAILNGDFKAGDRLPTERELMESFKVSRAVARQATMHLEHQGLVRVQVGAGGGAFVEETGVDTVLEAFENLFRYQGVELEVYLDAKRAMEPALAAYILTSVTDDDLAALQSNLDRSRAIVADDADDADDDQLDLSLEFHELLVRATHNPVMEALFIAMVRIAQRVPAFRAVEHPDWKTVVSEHEHMLELLRHRSPDFERALLNHLDSVDRIYR